MNRRRERVIKPLVLVDISEPLSEEELEELAEWCPDMHLKKGKEFYRHDERRYEHCDAADRHAR